MTDLDTLYTVDEIAGFMSKSRSTVFRLIKSGDLESVRCRGSRYVTRSQLVDFVERLKSAQTEAS